MPAGQISLSEYPKDALRAAITPLAERFSWRLVVLFGSLARAGLGRDLDFAVLPRVPPDLMEQGRWWSELNALFDGVPTDLLVLGLATSPVTRFEVLREGLCLYEDEPGLFDREQDRAFFLFADSEWIRRQMREVLYGRTET